MKGNLFDDSFPPPEPEGLGKVEVGVETMADGRRVLTVAATDADGRSTLARLTEKGAVRLANEVSNRMFLAWPLRKGN